MLSSIKYLTLLFSALTDLLRAKNHNFTKNSEYIANININFRQTFEKVMAIRVSNIFANFFVVSTKMRKMEKLVKPQKDTFYLKLLLK